MIPRPLVAVTATTRPIEGVERVRLNRAYLEAVEEAGMIPLLTAPLSDLAAADEMLRAVDGLLLTGGEDIDPARYGALRHEKTYAPHPPRDAWELALVDAAQRRALPTLAICRGIQVVNVALGGTLVQDIASERPGALAHEGAGARGERVHDVTVEEGSRLHGLLGATTVRTNSSHHQSVDRVAEGLRVTARAPDGIVEGVEWMTDGWWMAAVQWHPEELTRTKEPWDRNLLRGFAGRCRQGLGAPA